MRFYNRISFLIDNLIWIILLVVFTFFVTQSEHFLTERNISNILTAAAVLGVLVVGQTFVLISGNFDLSTESTLGLSALLGLWHLNTLLPWLGPLREPFPFDRAPAH